MTTQTVMVPVRIRRRSQLISDAYLEENRRLHAQPNGFGGKGRRWLETVLYLQQRFECSSVLDYGCGQGSLRQALADRGMLWCREFDPAIPGKDLLPLFADLVVCTDVLEHVEPDKIHNVLHHIHWCARKAIFLSVALDPTAKTLSDGRQAHILLRPAAWWDAMIEQEGMEHLDLGDVPLPYATKPDKQEKRWIALARPRNC